MGIVNNVGLTADQISAVLNALAGDEPENADEALALEEAFHELKRVREYAMVADLSLMLGASTGKGIDGP